MSANATDPPNPTRASAPDTASLFATMFDRYVKMFFDGDALRRIFFYMCNKCTIEVIDPICTTLRMFITTPVIFAVTQLGLVPFRNCPLAVFPFTHMSPAQKQTILELLTLTEEHGAGRVSTQLGGGCRVTLSRKHARSATLDTTTVLTCFCDAVLASKQYSSKLARVNICNIVLQRIGASIGLSRNTIHTVHERIIERTGVAQKDKRSKNTHARFRCVGQTTDAET